MPRYTVNLPRTAVQELKELANYEGVPEQMMLFWLIKISLADWRRRSSCPEPPEPAAAA